MKLEVKVNKRHFYVILVVLLSLSGAVFVFAQGAPDPGHDFLELEGVQARIIGTCPPGETIRSISPTDGSVLCEPDDVGGIELGVKDCYMTQPRRWSSSVGHIGFYAKGIVLFTNNNWDGYGVMYCRADPDADNELPFAIDLIADCPWGWGGINCNALPTLPTGHEYP